MATARKGRWLVVAAAACLMSLLCRFLPPVVESASTVHCGHPDYKDVCFEDTVQARLVYSELEPAVIRCVVRNLGKHVVAWMRNDGGDIPLTIGKTVFTPDKRVKIDYSSPDEWNLVIRGAHVKDSGEYMCQVNVDSQLREKVFLLVVKAPESVPAQLTAEDDQGSPLQKSDMFGQELADQSRVLPKSLLNDGSTPVDRESIDGPSTVHIYGRRLVFRGEQFVSLTCTAVFRTLDAKRNAAATVEWYHQGLRQGSNASSRMDVSMSWKDGDTAVSVLTLYSVRLGHAGEWVCLKRPSELADRLETASHHLTVLEGENLHRQRQQPQSTRAESLGLGGGASAVGGCDGPLLRLLAASLGAASLLTVMLQQCHHLG